MCGAAGANSPSIALLPSRATNSRPRTPPHELSPPPPCSISLSSRSFCLRVRPHPLPVPRHVRHRAGRPGLQQPALLLPMQRLRNCELLPLGQNKNCIIRHAVQVYSSIQPWIIHKHPRVSIAYFAAAAACRITRSTLSGMVAYRALSSRAWPHESASLTLKSVLGRMRSSPSEGTMLSAWMSLAL